MAIMTYNATGAAAVAETVAPGRAWQLEGVRVHLNAAGVGGNLTLTMDAGAGAVYDVVLATQDMSSVIDYVYQPTRPHQFVAEDELDIAWANANTKTYGLTVLWSLI